jgi:hypothetical protein
MPRERTACKRALGAPGLPDLLNQHVVLDLLHQRQLLDPDHGRLQARLVCRILTIERTSRRMSLTVGSIGSSSI